MDTIKMENTYQLPTYAKMPLVINHGKGAYVWDQNGKKYLDFYGGHAVALVGHCHPGVVAAVKKQLNKLIFYSNVVYNDQRALAAKNLIDLNEGKFTSVFFCNSGSEANETSIKLAKKYTGKDEIISFIGSFHGRTLGSLSVSNNDKLKKHIGSLMPNVKFATFGDIKSVKKLVSGNCAAIILEPIQSIAGINEAEKSFYAELEKFAKKKGIVLIFDEIQTGLGRTGKTFFSDIVGVSPDITTLAKGIAGGLPAAVTLVNKKISQSVVIGDQGSTFGGGPVICAAINATLGVIKKKNLANNAWVLGNLLKEKIKYFPHVQQVKGEGLLLGIEMDIEAKNIQSKLLHEAVITGTSDNPNILRLLPPLIITKKEVEIFINKLEKVLKEH